MTLRTVVSGTLLSVSILWAVVAMAQMGAVRSRSAHASGESTEAEEHAHQPRHGGYFGDADDRYHYEVLIQSGNRLILYVNDDHNRPLDVRNLHGRWTVNPDSEHPSSGTFAPSPDGAYFLADLPPLTGDTLQLTVAVLKGDTWAELEFALPIPN